MENQHRQISGYRELNQEEIDLMNEAKDLEARFLEFASHVEDTLDRQSMHDQEENKRQGRAKAYRWLSIGRTDIETGTMAFVRAITQPQPKE